jgi:hypothetical protein
LLPEQGDRNDASANNGHTIEGATRQAFEMSEFPQNSTIVLVHAAWADGTCWGNIVLPLKRRGLYVTCAPIPMTGSSVRMDGGEIKCI